MKSALPKMLHPLLGRTLVGHVLAAADEASPPSRSSSSGTAPTRCARTSPRSRPTRARSCRPSSAAPVTRSGSRSSAAGRSTARWSSSTATCRCCAPRRCVRWSHAHETTGAAGDRADRRGADPTGLRPDRAQPRTARSTRSWRSATRRRTSGRSARSTPGSTPSTPSLLRADARQADHRQRAGRGVPHRRDRPARRGGQPVVAHRAPDADRGARRATTGPSWPRCARVLRDRVNDGLDARRRRPSSTRRPPGST